MELVLYILTKTHHDKVYLAITNVLVLKQIPDQKYSKPFQIIVFFYSTEIM